MEFNLPLILATALLPLIAGFIWYHPKVFGTVWMHAAGVSPEKPKGGSMIKIFVLTYVLSFFAAFSISFAVIHQFHVFSILLDEPGFMDKGSEVNNLYTGFMEKYGNNFRTFKHGALHGTITGLLLITPVIAVNALFEQKKFKYMAVNGGFWIFCFAIMGGIICAFM